MPLVEKSRGLSPGGRFPPSFIHQVIIITGLNKLQLYVLALKMALDADRAGRKPPTQPNPDPENPESDRMLGWSVMRMA